jgi:hypothetical protein
MIDLADRALRKLRELQFNRDARAVLASAPVRAVDDGVILFSMIGTRVVLPYLVAAKSLHARLGRGRFAILDDGTLTEVDKDLLARHLDHPEIRSIHAVDTGAAPRGGCWERLLTLLELRRDAYVIQLDSDTVTLGPVEEITQAIAAGRNFTLRGDRDAAWLPVGTLRRRSRRDAGKRPRPDQGRSCDGRTVRRAARTAPLRAWLCGLCRLRAGRSGPQRLPKRSAARRKQCLAPASGRSGAANR